MKTSDERVKSVSPRHEKDVDVGLVAKMALFGVVIIAFVLVAMYGLVRVVRNHEASLNRSETPYAVEPAPFVGPNLQVSPPQDLRKVLANERAILSSYGWIDQDLGVVRIPIERAMDVLAERGLPYSGDGAEEPTP